MRVFFRREGKAKKARGTSLTCRKYSVIFLLRWNEHYGQYDDGQGVPRVDEESNKNTYHSSLRPVVNNKAHMIRRHCQRFLDLREWII